MAKEKEKTLEEIQREIAEVELETKQLNLAEARDRNEKFKQAEATRHKHNRQRQSELKQTDAGQKAIIRACRHKSGGSPTNVLKGGGIGSFSILTRALMPDGVTVFIQCARCPLKIYFRDLTAPEEAKLKKGDPEKYETYLEGKRLFEISKDQGIEHAELRGPTFFFQNSEGVPVIPDRV